jgi:hypothetical protein
MIGRYQCSLVLANQDLDFCPSMKPETIVLYFKWRTGKEGEPLNFENGNRVHDVYGAPLNCVGSWIAPINVEQARSAITCAHDTRDQSGRYSTSCAECILADSKQQYYECNKHRGNPHLWDKGNPRDSKVVYFLIMMKGYLRSKSDYIANGDSALLPEQLRAIRVHLLSTNRLYDFMLYVMILILCRMFMREDNVIQLGYHSVNEDITIVKEGGRILGIAVTFQGKSDANPVTLMVWNDDKFPEFCAVRHLVAWLSISGITKGIYLLMKGYFFPSKERLRDMIINKKLQNMVAEKKRISYTTVLLLFKGICTDLAFIGRWGCHTCRKQIT